MTKPYFTLLEREAPGQPYSIQFGDYDRKVVSDEMRDLIDHHYPTGRRAKVGPQWRILRTPDDKQATIDAAVAQLNTSKVEG